MNVLTNTWRQLVRRRLWPVALLLVAALVAVPTLLARDANQVADLPEPVPAGAVKVDKTLGDPVVALASDADRDLRRRVLGARKDPFRPKATPTPEPTPEPMTVETQDTGGAEPKAVDGGGSTAPADAPAPVSPEPAPVAPVEPEPVEAEEPEQEATSSVTVRFGERGSDSRERVKLEPYEVLPENGSGKEAVLMYLGPTKDRTSATFLVNPLVDVSGDARCEPDPADCEGFYLGKGKTAFLDLKSKKGDVVAQYRLDLVKVHAAADEPTARRSGKTDSRPSKAARFILRAASQ